MLRGNLRIEATKSTPETELNRDGFIRIRGRSVFSDNDNYCCQVDNWVNEYLNSPADVTCIDFRFEYLPTSSTKFYIALIQKIVVVTLMKKQYLINWYYDEGDDDIHEKGEYISSILNIPVNFIRIADSGKPRKPETTGPTPNS
jgi:hypothetical protein